MEKLIEQMPQIITAITTGLAQAIPKIFSAAVSAFQQIVEALFKIIPKAVSAVGRVIGSIVTGLKNAWSSAVNGVIDIGKNIVLGIWDGISSMWSWITDKVGGFFGGLVDGVKDLLGIHSPSRVFADLAQYIPQGVAVGIEKSAKTAYRAIDDLSKGMQTRFGDIQATVGLTPAGALAGAGGYGQQNITYNFTQTNQSPQALDALTIQRQTQSLLNFRKMRGE